MKIDNLNIKGNFNMNFLNATLCWREKNMLRGNNNLSKKSLFRKRTGFSFWYNSKNQNKICLHLIPLAN